MVEPGAVPRLQTVAFLQDRQPAALATVVPMGEIVDLVVRPLLGALAYLHQQGIVHRVSLPASAAVRSDTGHHRCVLVLTNQPLGCPGTQMATALSAWQPGKVAEPSPGTLEYMQDIKPENAVFTRAGCLKLVDFGLALALALDEGAPARMVSLGFSCYQPKQVDEANHAWYVAAVVGAHQ